MFLRTNGGMGLFGHKNRGRDQRPLSQKQADKLQSRYESDTRFRDLVAAREQAGKLVKAAEDALASGEASSAILIRLQTAQAALKESIGDGKVNRYARISHDDAIYSKKDLKARLQAVEHGLKRKQAEERRRDAMRSQYTALQSIVQPAGPPQPVPSSALEGWTSRRVPASQLAGCAPCGMHGMGSPVAGGGAALTIMAILFGLTMLGGSTAASDEVDNRPRRRRRG